MDIVAVFTHPVPIHKKYFRGINFRAKMRHKHPHLGEYRKYRWRIIYVLVSLAHQQTGPFSSLHKTHQEVLKPAVAVAVVSSAANNIK